MLASAVLAAPLAAVRPGLPKGHCMWYGSCSRAAVPPAKVQRQRRRRSRPALSPPPCSAAAEGEMEISGEYCMPAYVIADQKRSMCFTVLDVEVADYPGLMRVIAWTLNGLDVVAQNAVMRTSDSGMAHNTFWLTTRAGEKLKDAAAELLAERVRDFVMYCSPDEGAANRTEFCAGPIFVSNSQHEQYTVVVVQEPQPTPGFLLEVASALSGMNVQISQGIVQGVSCESDDDDESVMPALEQQLDEGTCLISDDTNGRVFKFWVQDSRGNKLDYSSISALVYTLSSVLGYRSHPTSPPDQELLFNAH